MDNHVIIRRIRATGEKKCDYLLEEGLNIFAGSNSTGKTTLLLLIDYIFGSTIEKFIPEVENFTDFVYVDIIINSREYTIKRGIKKDKKYIYVFSGHFEDLTILSSVPYKLYTEKGQRDAPSISEFYLNELEIESKKVKITKTTGKMAKFSWRNLLNLVFIPQNGFDKIQPRNSPYQPLMKKAVFEVLFDLSDNELEQLEKKKIKIEERKNEIDMELKTLTKLLDQEKRELGSNKRIKEITEKIDYLNLKKKELYESLELKNETIELTEERKILEETLNSIELKLSDLKNRLNELEILKNENKLEIERNRILMKSRKIFSEIPITRCPKCFHELPDSGRTDTCYVCGNKFETEDFEKEYARNLFLLIDEKKELSDLINNVKGELEKLSREEETAKKRILFLNQEIDRLNREIISPVLRKIEEINSITSELNLKLGKSKQLNDLIQKETNHKKQSKIYKNNLKQLKEHIELFKKEEEYAKDVKNKFKTLFDNILMNALNFTSKIEDYDENYIPILDESIFDRKLGEGTKRSKTLKVILAYYTAVLEYSLKYGSSHPKILILDTPRQDELDMPVFENLLLYWKELKNYDKPYQVIITGSEFPASDQIKGVTIDWFHNQKASGDYSKPNKFAIQ